MDSLFRACALAALASLLAAAGCSSNDSNTPPAGDGAGGPQGADGDGGGGKGPGSGPGAGSGAGSGSDSGAPAREGGGGGPGSGGPPGVQAYRDYGAFPFLKNGSPWLSQSVIDLAGKVGYARDCPIAEKGGPEWSSCSAWGSTDLSTLRGVGNEVYWGYGAYAYVRGGNQYVVQSLVAEGGKVGWAHECPVGPAGVGWGACLGWAQTDLTTVRGVGNEAYRDYGGYLVTANGKQELSQSLVSADGKTGYARGCPVDPDAGVLWGSCGGWQTVDLSTLRGIGNEAYTGYGAFAYPDGSGALISQSVVDLRGTTGYARGCPLDGDGNVLWGSCGSWASLDLTHLR